MILKYVAQSCDCMIIAFRNSGTALHHTTLYCTTEYGTALYCTPLHCTEEHYITLDHNALHCTLLHCTALHCTALHITVLHCTALCCILLHACFFENLMKQNNSRTGRTALKIVAYHLVVSLESSLSSRMS